jgi:nitrile hydratase accessory protein
VNEAEPIEPAGLAALSGPEAPPRRNGELAFDEPWESRLFGITMALCERGVIEWDEFRRRLIDEIARWDAAHPEGGPVYWQRWEQALLGLLSHEAAVDLADLQSRAAELSHDHHH